MEELQIKGFNPHPDQRRVLDEVLDKNSSAKYFVLTFGRQWGKTMMMENLILKWALEDKGSLLMWVSPIYSQAKKVFEEIHKAIAGTPIVKKINQSNLEIEFINNSKIIFKSGEREDGLRGYTLDYLVVDEAGFIKDSVWDLVLRQTTLVKGKKVVFISTPKGKNYLYNLYLRGQDEENLLYKSLRGTSYDTPFISAEEIEEARISLPEDIFRQEMLGEFIDNGGEVFSNLDEIAILQSFSEPQNSRKYYGGVDFGKQEDYSVLTILDELGRVVFIYRDRRKEWNEIVRNMNQYIKKYNAVTLVEVNNVGDVLYEQMKKNNSLVHPFVTTNASKQNIIEDLIYAFNERQLSIPSKDFYPNLYNELSSFTYQYSPKTRKVIYGHPAGAHDDCVLSLAIAYNSLKSKKSAGTYAIY